MAQLIIARVIKVALFFVAIIEGQGIRIEGTPDNFGSPGIGRKVRQIHIIKKARLHRFCDDVGQDGSDPLGGASPMELYFRFAVMGHRDSGPAVQNRFAHRRNRAGIVNIGAEVGAVIDSAENPPGVRNHFQQSESHAIRRSAVDGVAFLAAGLDPDALLPGHPMTNARLRPGRSDDNRIAERLDCAHQCFEARGIDAVVVGEKELHGSDK